MRKIYPLIILYSVFMLSCSMKQTVTNQSTNPELNNFINQTNLVYAQGKFWIKDIPEVDNALGSIYKKVTKTIDTSEFTAFIHVADFGFGIIPDSALIKQNFTYSKDYTFKRDMTANIAVVSMLSASYNNVSEVKKKVALSEVWGFNPIEKNLNSKYCKPDYYYVSRIYLGSSSDFGLQEVTGQAKFAGFDVGAEFKASQSSSMHVIKEGVLSLMLSPVSNISACDSSSIHIKNVTRELTPEILEQELINDEYNKN